MLKRGGVLLLSDPNLRNLGVAVAAKHLGLCKFVGSGHIKPGMHLRSGFSKYAYVQYAKIHGVSFIREQFRIYCNKYI